MLPALFPSRLCVFVSLLVCFLFDVPGRFGPWPIDCPPPQAFIIIIIIIRFVLGFSVCTSYTASTADERFSLLSVFTCTAIVMRQSSSSSSVTFRFLLGVMYTHTCTKCGSGWSGVGHCNVHAYLCLHVSTHDSGRDGADMY